MELSPAIAKHLVRLLALVAALAVGPICSAAAAQGRGQMAAAAEDGSGEPGWWSAFHDPVLELLLARGAAAHADRGGSQRWEALATAAYVKLRVAAAQARTASALREAAQVQLELLQVKRQGKTQRAGYAVAVLLDSAGREQRSQAQAMQSLASLSVLLHTPRATLAAVLQPVLADPHLPQADVGLPGEPGFRLLGDPDADMAGRADAFMVADEQMQQQAAYAFALQAQYRRVQQAFVAGRIGAFEALVALQAAIAAQDGLAAAMGEQSLAWIAWQQGVAGAGAARATVPARFLHFCCGQSPVSTRT